MKEIRQEKKEWEQQRVRNYYLEQEDQVENDEKNSKQLHKQFLEQFSPKRLLQLSSEQFMELIFDIGKGESIEHWMQVNKAQSCCQEADSEVMFYNQEKRFINKAYLKNCTLKEYSTIKKEIYDCLRKGFLVISEREPLRSLEDYETFDQCLFKAIGMNAYLEWIHQYLYWIAPEEFSIWHSEIWQKHIMFAYGIHPSHVFYGRSGQISLLARKAKLTMEQFAVISYKQFGDPCQFFRIGTSDRGEDYFIEWKENNIAAVGWSDLGPLEQYVQGEQLNRRELREKLQELYYPGVKQLASRKAKELINFYQASNHCIFVAMRGEQLLALGDQVGTYYYNESVKFSHRKSIQWHCCFAAGEKLPIKSEGLRTSFYELTNEENIFYLYQKYYGEGIYGEKYRDQKKQESKQLSTQKKQIRMPRTNPIHPLNQILYGAPGTGKTYATVEYALAIIENRAVVYEKQSYKQRKQSMERYEQFVQMGQIVFTTFHQSYGYEDFVQGIRPNIQSKMVHFKKTDGIFKIIAERAMEHPEKNYVLIIDEINRGNISKIFGELITLLEEDKRIGEVNQLIIKLPFGETFAVPNNLYLIGTMNSADQSISILDTALRRRFQFIEMPPNMEMIDDLLLQSVFQKLNHYLKKELKNTDLLIGHSFFMNRTERDLEMIFNHSIIPLLYEYFYNQEEKIVQALDCLKETQLELDSNHYGRIRVKVKKVEEEEN